MGSARAAVRAVGSTSSRVSQPLEHALRLARRPLGDRGESGRIDVARVAQVRHARRTSTSPPSSGSSSATNRANASLPVPPWTRTRTWYPSSLKVGGTFPVRSSSRYARSIPWPVRSATCSAVTVSSRSRFRGVDGWVRMFSGVIPKTRPARAGDSERVRRVLHVDRARQVVVAVDERVDDELADGVCGVVLDLDLDAARRVQRVHPAADGDGVEQRLDGGEQGSGRSDAGGRLAARARPVLVGEPVIGDGGGDRLGVTEDSAALPASACRGT